ncbi:trimethylamine methyltransferase family protein [Cochlodiniinecator piscidefendens]|uniref:trimethylamine methyltransferase family protein n=1 Tax=Cochlodiniinecator piscidefendens TaxID=2715756 RepID=UPI001409A5FB|nr:trimethylamine methyltransferase family protein [Cochlodiniinecator piscidefendens]
MTVRSRSRRRTATRAAAVRPPRRNALETINAAGAEEIFKGVVEVLNTVGMLVEDVESRAMLVAAGCREDADRIYYTEDVIRRALETVPRAIRFYNQNGDFAFATDDEIARFGTAVNCVQVLDARTDEYRPCVLSDISDHGRVQEALTHIDIAAALGYPSDMNAEEEALASARALLDTTKKPIFFTGHDEHGVRKIWKEMGRRVGGMGNLADKPIGLDLVGPVSPLKLGGETCQRLIMAARLNLPVVCYPAIFPGMACPLTLAGAITQATAESIAGIVISQLAAPGAPVMSGSSVMPMDMRRADMAIGSPEYTLAGLGAADVFRHLGIPSWVGSGCTDAHDIGPQAFAEASATLHGTSVARTALTHNLGVLSSGRTGSMEMLVACDEMAAMASAFGGGIIVNKDTIATEVIARASEDNSFLTDPHTLERYETEMWIPSLFQREGIENWQISDTGDLRARLKEKTLAILDTV